MTSLHRATNCVTHHHACDCREYRHSRIEGSLEQILDLADCEGRAVSEAELLGEIWLIAYNALNNNAQGDI